MVSIVTIGNYVWRDTYWSPSQRNKLMRIMLALSQEADFWNEQVKAWWDVVSRVVAS